MTFVLSVRTLCCCLFLLSWPDLKVSTALHVAHMQSELESVRRALGRWCCWGHTGLGAAPAAAWALRGSKWAMLGILCRLEDLGHPAGPGILSLLLNSPALLGSGPSHSPACSVKLQLPWAALCSPLVCWPFPTWRLPRRWSSPSFFPSLGRPVPNWDACPSSVQGPSASPFQLLAHDRSVCLTIPCPAPGSDCLLSDCR